MTADRQRQLLSFITGSDRIPATGTSALDLKLTCLGNDYNRLPTSHTCFNQLCIPRYRDRGMMEERLMRAMDERWALVFLS
jgi:E3 ubiquitin-protein ligase HECTD2